MAARAQIERVLKRLEQVHPAKCFPSVDETQAGIGAVLRLLAEADGTVTAGRISDVLQVSTARVAALLKKMAAKGLIIRTRSSRAARVTVVALTIAGRNTVNAMREEMYRQMGRVIDVVGEERLMEFIDTAEEIQRIVKPPEFKL